MPLLDADHAAGSESSSDMWQNTLKNTRILLHEYDTAIYNLVKLNHKSYSLNTGQSIQQVSRQDLPMLVEMRSILLSQITDLELLTGVRAGVKQVVPNF
jgi:hypothetical protein